MRHFYRFTILLTLLFCFWLAVKHDLWFGQFGFGFSLVAFLGWFAVSSDSE